MLFRSDDRLGLTEAVIDRAVAKDERVVRVVQRDARRKVARRRVPRMIDQERPLTSGGGFVAVDLKAGVLGPCWTRRHSQRQKGCTKNERLSDAHRYLQRPSRTPGLRTRRGQSRIANSEIPRTHSPWLVVELLPWVLQPKPPPAGRAHRGVGFESVTLAVLLSSTGSVVGAETFAVSASSVSPSAGINVTCTTGAVPIAFAPV